MKTMWNKYLALIGVGLIVANFGLFAPMAQAELIYRPLVATDFKYAAPRGFGDKSNSWAQSMAWWNNALYVGTSRESVCTSFFAIWNYVRLIISQEFADTYLPYPPRDPDLTCPPDGTDLPLQAEIWRWTPDTETWLRVFQSPLELDNPGPGLGEPPIPGKKLPYDIGFRGLKPHTEPDGTEALYAFGINSTIMWDSTILPPPRILRSTDGINFESVPQTPGTFLGDLPHNPDHSSFRSPESFGGKLFTLSGPIFGQGSLIASANPAQGDDAWFLASPPELMFYEMEQFNGWLYLGTLDGINGYSVVKTRAEGPPPYEFITVIPSGAFLPDEPSRSAVSMHKYNGRLYIGSATKTELIRINPDDTWELVVGSPRSVPLPGGGSEWKHPISNLNAGFGQSVNDHAWKMIDINGSLYIGTYNISTWFRDFLDDDPLLWHHMGAHLYRTDDGTHFRPITTNGFADLLDPMGGMWDYGIRTMASTPYGSFYGTVNDFHGLSILRAGWQETGFRPPTPEDFKPPASTQVEVEASASGGALLSWQEVTSRYRETVSNYQIWRAEVETVRIREGLNYWSADWSPEDGFLIEDTATGPYVQIAVTNDAYFMDSTVEPDTTYIYYVLTETEEGQISHRSNLTTFQPLIPAPSFEELLQIVNRNLDSAHQQETGLEFRTKILEAQAKAIICQIDSAITVLESVDSSNVFSAPHTILDFDIQFSRLLRRLNLFEVFGADVLSDEFCTYDAALLRNIANSGILLDIDNDGVSDDVDEDDDNDGLTDLEELTGPVITNPFIPDTDYDGIRDGLDPNPGTPGDNICDPNTSVAITVNQTIFDLFQCASPAEVILESETEVIGPTGHLQIIGPRINFKPGFKVQLGGKVSVYSEELPGL